MTTSLLKQAFGATILVVGLSISPAHAQSPGEQAYARVLEWGDRFNANDAAGVAALYAPDAPFWRTSATELTNGAEAFAYFDGFSAIEGREDWVGAFDEPMIYAVNDQFVVIGLVSSIDFGNGGALRYRHLFAVADIADSWLIVGHHSSPLVQPE